MKTKELSVPQKHQKRVALQTLRMNPAMLGVMGGMSKQEAITFLKSIGYTDADIEALNDWNATISKRNA